MEINLLYQSPEGHVYTFRQLAENPIPLPAIDKPHELPLGLEIVTSDGKVLYICLEFTEDVSVASFLVNALAFLKKVPLYESSMKHFPIPLYEHDNSTLKIAAIKKQLLLTCATESPGEYGDKYFYNYPFPIEEWIAATIKAINEYYDVIPPNIQAQIYWEKLLQQ